MNAPFPKLMASLAALAIVAPLTAPTAAEAQTYGYGYPSAYNQPAYPDPCRTDARSRATTGGVLGAAIGAIAGSQLAARGRRTEGSALGGVLGAAIGAGVGNSSANCNARYSGYNQDYAPPPPPPAYQAYGNAGYDYGYEDPYRQPSYDTRPDSDYRYAEPQPDYRQDYRYEVADQCRLAESVIRMPDGRTDTRYVRTCPDQNGRYRIVD